MTDSKEEDFFARETFAEAKPLAASLRPCSLDEVFGQDHLLSKGRVLREMVETQKLTSLLLWGPAGSGKTTLARILATSSDMEFISISAVISGVTELRKVFLEAENRLQAGKKTCLFVDEIHRFNKSQQDSFLPKIEEGIIVLIGATTENPSFELNAAILSRVRVYVLNRLDEAALNQILTRAETYLDKSLSLTGEARELLISLADGDGRYLLNMVEDIMNCRDSILDEETLLAIVQKRRPVHDKSDESHYNLISALHKSIRGSDTDASLYWLSRMLDGGEDPLYIARRLVRIAYEDVGLVDPQAVLQALAAWQTWERLGSPEGDIALAQVVIYLATAPKSNRVYRAFGASLEAAKKYGSLSPPKHILNAPTPLMKKLGYGKGYQYDHDHLEAFSAQNYFPENLSPQKFYQPVERGFEREIKKRLQYWQKLRDKSNLNKP